MKTITITSKTHGVHHVLVDDEDYEKVIRYTWIIRKGKNTYYVERKSLVSEGEKRTTISMHRQVMGVTDPKIQVDHKFHIGTDNRKSELRICSNKENCRNKAKHKIKTSIYKGVYFEKPRIRRGKTKSWFTKGRWRSCIRLDNKLISLGYYKSEIEAAMAYDVAAVKYFGEFAKLNLPS